MDAFRSARESCISRLVCAVYMWCMALHSCCFTRCAAISRYGQKQSLAALDVFRGTMVITREMTSLEPGGQRKAAQVGNQQGA